MWQSVRSSIKFKNHQNCSFTSEVGLCGEFRMSILVFGVMALYQNKGIKMCDKGKCAVQRREGAYNGIAQKN